MPGSLLSPADSPTWQWPWPRPPAPLASGQARVRCLQPWLPRTMARSPKARRLPPAVALEQGSPPRLEEKEIPQNFPNGRQLGQAEGGAGRAGPGRRCGTSSKGRALQSPGPGWALSRLSEAAEASWVRVGRKRPATVGDARGGGARWDCARSTPLQAAQDCLEAEAGRAAGPDGRV